MSDKKPYQWDFDGSCKPGSSGNRWNETFSVGVFQWIPKSKGKGLKRGRVVKRFRGLSNNPQPVYDKAEQFIAEKEGIF